MVLTASARLPSLQAAQAHVRALVKEARTSFSAGMACLPYQRRLAMHALYAFCRVVDDIADDDGMPASTRLRLLDEWGERIDRLFAGEPTEAITLALQSAIYSYRLRVADFHAIIAGMRMDGEHMIVAPPLAVLDLYCDRVASAVGRISVRIFGEISENGDVVAHHLGRALQLTNILRDLAEDAGRGRLYLPAEWLAAARMPLTPHEAITHPELPQLCEKLAKRAAGHFVQAAETMRHCAPAAMRPARLMGAYYAAILRKLRAEAWADVQQRVSLSQLEKIFLGLRYTLAA